MYLLLAGYDGYGSYGNVPDGIESLPTLDSLRGCIFTGVNAYPLSRLDQKAQEVHGVSDNMTPQEERRALSKRLLRVAAIERFSKPCARISTQTDHFQEALA
jgi:hypothetical protein